MSPRKLIVLTDNMASTAIGANKSSSLHTGQDVKIRDRCKFTHFPMILLDIVVFATLINASLPRESTFMLS